MKLYTRPLPAKSHFNSRAERDRAATLSLLSEIFGPNVEYSHHQSGAPKVTVNGIEHLISVSHSATTLAIATADGEETIGVDVETYRSQLERVKHRFLTETELTLFTSPLDLLKAWTAKEAVYKAAHTPGLALTEIDCTHMASGHVTARHATYHITFSIATLTETIAIAWR